MRQEALLIGITETNLALQLLSIPKLWQKRNYLKFKAKKIQAMSITQRPAHLMKTVKATTLNLRTQWTKITTTSSENMDT